QVRSGWVLGARPATPVQLRPSPSLSTKWTSSIIVRVTLEYDEMTGSATANYTITRVSLDGTVLYADSGSGVAIRLAVETPDMIGTPIPGLVIPSDGMSDAA